jgi:hypothetical protein
MPGPSKTIQFMSNSEQRMAKQHPRAGISHYLFGLGSSSRLIAVNRAVGTRRLVVSVRTFLKPYLNVVLKFSTRRAQDATRIVMVSRAIDTDHLGDG